MRFVLDENLPPGLAAAFAALEEPVVFLVDAAGRAGLKDPEVMELLGREGGFFIGRDRNILKNPTTIAAMHRHEVGAFFLFEGESSALELARVLFRAWPDIRRIAKTTPRPFAMTVHSTHTAVRPASSFRPRRRG